MDIYYTFTGLFYCPVTTLDSRLKMSGMTEGGAGMTARESRFLSLLGMTIFLEDSGMR